MSPEMLSIPLHYLWQLGMSLENTEKGIILLVDDNPTNLSVLFDSLSDYGFKILVAQDGESAIEQLEYILPDLILLDVMMPGIDGFETCRRLKENQATKDIPVIFMTALAETVDKVKGFQVGGVDYITKPIQPEEVLCRVQTHLTIQKLQKRLLEKNLHLQEEICDRKRAEEALRLLLNAVSHDLRNPVTGMLMVLKNLQQSPEEQIPVPRSILERMAESSDRQLRLINSLLEAHANEVQGVAVSLEQVQLSSLIQRIVEDWEPMLAQNQAIVKNLVPADLPAISADINQLWRVFENLIANAVKHNPLGVSIVIEAVVEAEMIRCHVQNDGEGMTQEQCASLFELYTRGKSARHTTGLGLGLYLCKQIITAHGGEIGVTSRPGEGTKFWFTLPLYPL